MLLYVLLLLFSLAEPINSALLEQEVIPQLVGEIQALEKKTKAKEEYFAGERALQDAFWEWRAAPLLSPSFLEAQLLLLQQEKMEREAEFFSQEDIQASDVLTQEFLRLEQQYLDLLAEEHSLKERLLLRLLRNIADFEIYDKIEHRLEEYSTIRRSLDLELDKKTIIDISIQEKYLREIKEHLVIHFSIPRTPIFDSLILEEKRLGEEAKTRIQVNGSLERLELLSSLDSRPEIQKILQLLEEKEDVFISLEKTEELFEAQKTWSPKSFSEQELRVLEQGLQKENNSLNRELSSQELQFQINQIKIDKIQLLFAERKELESKKIEKDLLLSQEKLEEAKQEQNEDQAVQNKIVALREKETDIRSNEAERREEFLEWFNKYEGLFEEQRSHNQKALTLSLIESERQIEIDQCVAKTHSLIRSFQKRILQLRTEIRELELQSQEVKRETSNKKKNVLEAEGDLQKAVLARQDNLRQEELVLVDLLVQMHQERRTIAKNSSFAMIEEVQNDFWQEIQFEWSLGSFMLYRHWKKISGEISSFRWNIQSISRHLQFWFLLGMGILIWRSIRRRVGMFWGLFYSWIWQQKIDIVGGKSIQLSSFTERSDHKEEKILAVLPEIIDLSALFFAIAFIEKEHFLLQMILRVMIFIKAWCLVKPLIGIWFPNGELSSKLQRGGFYLVFYVLGLGFISFSLMEMLYSQRSVELLQVLQLILLWVLLAHQLGVWSPIVLQRVKKIQGMEFLKKIMERDSDSWFGIRVKSLVGLIVIFIWFLNQILFFAAEHSQLIGGLLAKNSLQQEDVDIEFLSAETYSLIQNNNAKSTLLDTELEATTQVFEEWKIDRKRGLVAIVGRQGSGKTELIENFLLSVNDFSVQRIIKRKNRNSVLEEFETIYKRQFKNVSELVEYLRTRDSEVICLDNLHHAMFRDVNGYQGIRDLLTIMQGTAHQHFWVVVCHYHAWMFLHSPAIKVNLHIFRKEIFVSPNSFQELQNWFVDRASSLGFTLQFPDFTSIKTEEAKRRYQLAFWRVLADLSNGNPSVAELFWLDSLRKGDTDDVLQMVLYSIPQTDILNGLQDTDYFVLASILLHNGLSIEELQETLQDSFAIIQSSCRNLLGLGVIQKADVRYVVEPRWYASIEDILVTKRMIYLDL